jgi:hypothetical protein
VEVLANIFAKSAETRMAASGGLIGDFASDNHVATSINNEFLMSHSLPQQSASNEPKSGFYDYTRSVLNQISTEQINITPNDSNTTNVSRIRLYPLDHKGPYLVFIKEKNSPLAHITISKRINESFKNAVKTLTRVSRSKIRVELNTAKVANELLIAPFLGGYLTYIPAESVEIDGIINLEKNIDMKDITDNGYGKFSHPLVPPVKIVQAFRFRRFVGETGEVEKEKVYEDTETIRVTFMGTALPRWVCIHGLLVRVKMYNPKLMSCTKCLGDHHTAKHCTTGERCMKCKGFHGTKVCPDLSVWCPHCKKNVTHDSKEDCPTFFVRTRELITGMKKSSKKSYAEAVRQAEINTQVHNQFSILTPNDSDNVQQSTEGSSQIKFPRVPRNHNSDKSFVFGKRQRTRSPEIFNTNHFSNSQNMPPPPNTGTATMNQRKKIVKDSKNVKHTPPPPQFNYFNAFSGITSSFITQQILSFLATFDLNTSTRSMAEMVIPFLVEMLWPKFSKFMSNFSGTTASSNQNSFHNIQRRD